MRAVLSVPLAVGAALVLSSCDQEALIEPYFAMRDSEICAGLDPRTDAGALKLQEERTRAILQHGREIGVGPAIEAAERHWIETDGYGDKICPFQMVGELDEATPSLELYRAANDALEAAIAAEAK